MHARTFASVRGVTAVVPPQLYLLALRTLVVDVVVVVCLSCRTGKHMVLVWSLEKRDGWTCAWANKGAPGNAQLTAARASLCLTWRLHGSLYASMVDTQQVACMCSFVFSGASVDHLVQVHIVFVGCQHLLVA